MNSRQLLSFALFAILGGVTAWLVFLGRDGPGTQSSGEPKTADYCNVILVPSVAERLSLDLPLRLAAAQKGARLLGDLRNGNGRTPLQTVKNVMNEEIGSRIVRNYGFEMREMLPLEARRKFDRLYSKGKLVRVGFLMDDEESDEQGLRKFLVTYGWYEEEKNRKELKSLAQLERDLEASWKWIPSEDEAESLLDHEDEDVRQAADTYLDEIDGDAPSAAFAHAAPLTRIGRRNRIERRLREVAAQPESPTASRVDDEFAQAKERFDRRVAESNAEFEASRRRMDAERAERAATRAAEREAFREEVRAHQEAVRQRIEEARDGR